MRNGHIPPSNPTTLPLKNNRVVPPTYSQDYNSYGQPNNSYESPVSITPTKPLIPTSRVYPQRQSMMNPINPFVSDNNHSYNDSEYNQQPVKTSWWSKGLCFGLTRLSGGILFGTMLFLSFAAIAGLIISVVLYMKDSTVDPQWKILGMVVSSVMIITVLVTLLIFIYCYKKGHIMLNNNENNQGQHFQQPNNYNQSRIPPYGGYGPIENGTPSPRSENTVQVRDKLTNTEKTISSLRHRDYKRGVWPGVNAYGGISHRPVEPPRMAHRITQALPNDIDQSFSSRRNQQLFGGRPVASQPNYEIIEEIYETSRKRKPDEYIEYIELPKQSKREQPGAILPKPRYGDIVVKHVKVIEEANDDGDGSYNTDHFYQ
ncbi:hypothetical protein I4U23_012375 [Adineta vaga]|nr:hypothetical protein I4U23_012375 [Adineta vaga]